MHPVLVNQQSYLVDAGCGPVVEFKNNTFARIDNSFRYRNQYDAVPIQYNNTIYLWGGYGIFTLKNILTRYSFDTHEWNITPIKNRELVHERSRMLYVQKDSLLYLFGGIGMDSNQFLNTIPITDHTVYALNLQTMIWKEKGQYAISKDIIETKDNIFYKDHLIYKVSRKITEIDLFNNSVTTYKFANYKDVKSIVYHPKTKRVSYVYLTSKNERIVFSEPFKTFKGAIISSTPFYKPTTYTYIFKYVGAILLFIVLTAISYKAIKGYRLKNNVLRYSKARKQFYYHNNVFTTLSPQQKEILIYLTKNQEQYMLLSAIDDIALNGHENENHATTIKRRETLLKELSTELGMLLSLNKNEVFVIRRNSLDKRVKEMKLNFIVKIT
ncbi:MAG: hypothetical protein P8K77_01390 [Polaribacter sp.]|nr:hypothetical protein [Polaribacter sp.]